MVGGDECPAGERSVHAGPVAALLVVEQRPWACMSGMVGEVGRTPLMGGVGRVAHYEPLRRPGTDLARGPRTTSTISTRSPGRPRCLMQVGREQRRFLGRWVSRAPGVGWRSAVCSPVLPMGKLHDLKSAGGRPRRIFFAMQSTWAIVCMSRIPDGAGDFRALMIFVRATSVQ